jgi:polyhydroxybutyrate depolymerase
MILFLSRSICVADLDVAVTGVLGNEDPAADQFECSLGSSEGRPVPYIHIHGTADQVVPFDGNGAGFKSVEETVATFRDLNLCGGAGPGEVTYQNNTVTCTSYCPDDTNNVTKCRVEGGGHDWFAPGSCPDVGCSDIDSTAVVVDFFLRHSRE